MMFEDMDVLSNQQYYYLFLHGKALEILKHENCYNKKSISLEYKKIVEPNLVVMQGKNH
jgi:hypothetical protein